MKLTERGREALTGLSYVSIWIVGFLAFTLIPLIQTFWLSLHSVKVTSTGIKKDFIGWQNYKDIFFTDPDFVEDLIEYLSQIIVYVPIIVVFALIISLLLNTKIKGQGIYRTIFFLPVIITSGPVITNLINQGAASLPGIEDYVNLDMIAENFPKFISNSLIFLLTSFVMILWFSGIQILIFLSVLQKSDKSMYEAASIDGASPWESFWKLTLPMLAPTIMVVTVFTLVMQSLFSLNPVINKISADLKKEGFGYGYAASMSWVFFLVMILIIALFALIAFLFARKGKKKDE